MLKICKQFDPPTPEEINSRSVELGEVKKQKTLILDMDETLIHAVILQKGEEPRSDGDFTITLSSEDDGDELKISVKMRPHMEDILDQLSRMFEIVVFTAGEQEYADAVLDFIDEERAVIQHRLYRQHCIKREPGFYIKDLRIIKDRDLEDVVLVDNSIISFAFNMDNGIPISPFYRGQKSEKDEELLYMLSYLEEINGCGDDVQERIKESFKLSEIMAGC